ncbi:hypothetical protein KCU77_g4342, partial [Aureobasidium melanogenum]
MGLPTELRIMIYGFILGGNDPFKTLYSLVQGDSRIFKTSCCNGVPQQCPLDSSRDSSLKGFCDCQVCTGTRALAMLSLLMTSHKIRDEVVLTVRHRLRPLGEARLFVEAQRYYTGWKAAVVYDSNEHPTDFVIPGDLTPDKHVLKTERPYFLWPKNMATWKKDSLMQVFDSLTCSVSWNHYFRVQITITISDDGEKSVNVRLEPHPHWRDGFTTYPNEYVEMKETNDTAIAKLQAGMQSRTRAFPKIHRELAQDVVGILSNIGYHFVPWGEIVDSHGLPCTFRTMWHISVPRTVARKEKWSKEAGMDLVRKLDDDWKYSCCSM